MRVDSRDSRQLRPIVRRNSIPWTHLICIMRSGHEIFFSSTPFDSITSPDATACKSGRMFGLRGRFRCLEQVAPTEGSDLYTVSAAPRWRSLLIDSWPAKLQVTSFQLCSCRTGLLALSSSVTRHRPHDRSSFRSRSASSIHAKNLKLNQLTANGVGYTLKFTAFFYRHSTSFSRPSK